MERNPQVHAKEALPRPAKAVAQTDQPCSIRLQTGRSFNQLVVPKELRRQVMSVNHESAFSGHIGAKKTEVRILPIFFWPGLRQYAISSYLQWIG